MKFSPISVNYTYAPPNHACRRDRSPSSARSAAAEWEFFNRIISDYQSDLPSPDIIINLTCPPLVQMDRIKSRGRSFESGYTLEYLQSITDRLGEYAESLAKIKETTLLTFDSEKHDITKPSGQKELLLLLKPNLL